MADRSAKVSVAFVGLALPLFAVLATPTTALPMSQAKENLKVLFVGNSLTQASDLPGLFSSLTTKSSSSIISVTSGQSTEGGTAFKEHSVDPSHYNDPGLDGVVRSVAKIREGGWDFVLLQDQSGEWFEYTPRNLPQYSREYTNPDGTTSRLTFPQKLVNEVRAQGGVPIFYMDWQSIQIPMNEETYPTVDNDFSYLCGLYNTMCACFGNAMLLNMKSENNKGKAIGNCTFVGCTDDIHPSLLTQYTNACVLYATITGKSPIGLEYDPGLSSSQNITMLQENAWNAYQAYRRKRLSECNETLCIQFMDNKGHLIPIPGQSTPNPLTVPTDPSGKLADCPTVCLPAFDECKGVYSEDDCLQLAEYGFLCTENDVKIKCDATDLRGKDAPPLCPGDQYFSPSACVPTCEIPQPSCDNAGPGCVCPNSRPVWDIAKEKCIPYEECPATGHCDGLIGVNYMDAGNSVAVCPHDSDGDECKAPCLTNICVPKADYRALDKFGYMCQNFSEPECGQTNGKPNAEKCRWAKDTKAITFVCLDHEWVIASGSATCDAGLSANNELCEYFKATQCLDEAPCTAAMKDQCRTDIAALVSKCQNACAIGDKSTCNTCWLQELDKGSDSAHSDVPDAAECCGCMLESFADAGIAGSTAKNTLLNNC